MEEDFHADRQIAIVGSRCLLSPHKTWSSVSDDTIVRIDDILGVAPTEPHNPTIAISGHAEVNKLQEFTRLPENNGIIAEGMNAQNFVFISHVNPSITIPTAKPYLHSSRS